LRRGEDDILNASERRLEIPTHSRDKITEGAPIEVVAVPAGGGEAAWLSNGAVYRSFGPKRTAKLCNANSCFLSYSPNGELLAVLSWADRNDKRKLEVYDQLGGSRKASDPLVYGSSAESVHWLSDSELCTYGAEGATKFQVGERNLIRISGTHNSWGAGTLFLALDGLVTVCFDDRTEIIRVSDGETLCRLEAIDSNRHVSFATCSESAVAWIDSSGNGNLLTNFGLSTLDSNIEAIALDGDVVVATWMKGGKVRFQRGEEFDLPLNSDRNQGWLPAKRFFWENERLIAGSDDGQVRVSDRNGDEVASYTAIDLLTPQVSLGFRSDYAVTTGRAGQSRVWKSGKAQHQIRAVEGVVWSTDSSEFASVVDRGLTIFDLSLGTVNATESRGDWQAALSLTSERFIGLAVSDSKPSIHCLGREFTKLWPKPASQYAQLLTPIRYATTGDSGFLVGQYGELNVLNGTGLQVDIKGLPKIREQLGGLVSTSDMRSFCWVVGTDLRWGKFDDGLFDGGIEPIKVVRGNDAQDTQCLSLNREDRGVVVDQPGLLFFERELANPVRVVLKGGGTPTHVSWIDDDLVQVATAEGELVTVRYSDAQRVSASAKQTSEDSFVNEPAPFEATMKDPEPPEERHGVVGIHGFRDSPTADDQLGRDRFRASLAQSIIDLTGPTELDGKGGENGDGEPAICSNSLRSTPSEFPAILVGGSWGSGKSSVLKKFQEERETPKDKQGDVSGETSMTVRKGNLGEPKGLDDFEWKFAHFNAWTNEHLSDPSAGLLKALRESATENLNSSERIGFRAREMMIRFFGDQGSIMAVWAFAALWFVSLIILGVAKKPLATIGIPAVLLTGLKSISGARNVVFWDRFRATPLRSNSFVSGLTETKCLANWYRAEVHRPRKPKFNVWISASAGVATSAALIVWTNIQPSVVESRRQLQAHWPFAFCVIVVWALCLIAYGGNGAFSKKVLRLPLMLPILIFIDLAS
jgi:KAP family P-loop domain